VLAAKLVLVALLVGLGAINRFRLVPRLSLQAPARRWLATSIGCELVLAVAILALVALWRFTPPPRALAAVVAPVALHLHGERLMAEIAIDRVARPGGKGARAELSVLDGEFRPLAVREVALVLANPAAGIEPIRRAAVRLEEPYRWRVEDVRIPLPGQWTVRVEALVSDFEKLSVEDKAALPRLP
jgi:copper transport protein